MRGASTRRYAVAAIAAAALVLVAYANSLPNAFHFDDQHVIENNAYLRSLGNIPRFFTDASTFSSIPSHASYRPVLSVTLAIDYALAGGLDVAQFHRTQIALLLVVGALLAMFYVAVLRPGLGAGAAMAALFSATLFSVHTANTETLNFISSRSEELAVAGVVGGFLVYLRWPRARRTGAHLVPVFLGALAKIHAVMYAPLLFTYVWLWPGSECTPRERTTRAFAATWPSVLVCAAMYLFVRHMDAPEWTGGGTAALPYAWTQPFAWLHYARLFVLPVGLTADSDWTVFAAWHDTRALAGDVFVAVLLAVTWLASKRMATRPIAFGLAWFAIALLPTSSVVPFSEIVNEHRVFFPFVGLALAAGCATALLVARVGGARSPAGGTIVAAALVVLVAHTAGTRERNRVWRDDESLWRDVVQQGPANGRAWMNYGLARMTRGDYVTARAYFERAAALTPNYSYLEINLGIVHGALGDPAAAERHFTRALTLSADGDSHYYYARWLAGAGRGPEALSHVRDAVRISAAHLYARHLMMRLLAASDETEALVACARDTLNIDPRDDEAVAYVRGDSPLAAQAPTLERSMSAGFAALNARRYDEAAEYYRHATALDARSADAWNDRGWAQLQLGFADAAAASFRRALAIDATHARARNNLALVESRR